MSDISQWNVAAASNTSAPPDGAPEGMAPSTVNDTIREIMAAIARWYSDSDGSLTSGGSSNTYTLTTNSTHAALADIPLLTFRANHTNTGNATLNVDSLGAKSLNIGGAEVASSGIVADTVITVAYNATNDTFDIVNMLTGWDDASTLTTGELPDARLSSNVPLLDQANTFSAVQYIQTTAPFLELQESDASADNKNWRFVANGETFYFYVINDANSVSDAVFVVERTGASVDSIDFQATNTLFNGGDLPIANGGTAASTAADARTNLAAAGTGANETISGDWTFTGTVSTDNSSSDQVGYSGAPLNTQNGNYTTVLTDAGKTIHKASGGAGETITIDSNANVAYPTGTMIAFSNSGGGDLTIAITSDTLVWSLDASTGSRTLADGGLAVAIKVASTTWKIAGNGLS